MKQVKLNFNMQEKPNEPEKAEEIVVVLTYEELEHELRKTKTELARLKFGSAVMLRQNQKIEFSPRPQMVFGKGGIVYKVSSTPVYEGVTPIGDNMPGLEVIRKSAKYKLPPLPSSMMKKIWTLFREVYKKYATEVVAFMFYDPKENAYFYWVPRQKVTPTATTNLEGGIKLFEDMLYVGSIHSHAVMSAFHSSVDDADEKFNNGLHITLGKLNYEDRFDIACSLMIDGTRTEFSPREILEVLEGIKFYEKPSIIQTVKKVLTGDGNDEKVDTAAPEPHVDTIENPVEDPTVISEVRVSVENGEKPTNTTDVAETQNVDNLTEVKLDSATEPIIAETNVENATDVQTGESQKEKPATSDGHTFAFVTIDRWVDPEDSVREGYLWAKFKVECSPKVFSPHQQKQINTHYSWVKKDDIEESKRNSGHWLPKSDDSAVMEFRRTGKIEALKYYFNKFYYWCYNFTITKEIAGMRTSKPGSIAALPVTPKLEEKKYQPTTEYPSTTTWYSGNSRDKLYSFVDQEPISEKDMAVVMEELEKVDGPISFFKPKPEKKEVKEGVKEDGEQPTNTDSRESDKKKENESEKEEKMETEVTSTLGNEETAKVTEVPQVEEKETSKPIFKIG